MPIDTFIAFVAVYDAVDDAKSDYELVKDLHTDANLIDAYDAALIERKDDGKVKIAKVNVDHNRATAMKYHVRSIPMLLLFKNGQVQATQIGAVGKAQLSQMIDKAI